MYYGRFTEAEWECIAWAKAYKTREEVKTKKQKLLARQVYKPYKMVEHNRWAKAFWYTENTYVNKMFVPGELDDKEWAEFKDAEWIETNSPYDCSGKEFTVGMDKYKVPGGTWIYHFVSFDY